MTTMKLYIFLAATALTLAACTNDETATPDSPVALKVNASIGTIDTRAAGTQWTLGDQIGISTVEGTDTDYANYATNGTAAASPPRRRVPSTSKARR